MGLELGSHFLSGNNRISTLGHQNYKTKGVPRLTCAAYLSQLSIYIYISQNNFFANDCLYFCTRSHKKTFYLQNIACLSFVFGPTVSYSTPKDVFIGQGVWPFTGFMFNSRKSLSSSQLMAFWQEPPVF